MYTQKTTNTDFAQSLIIEQLRQMQEELRAIRKQGEPVKTWHEMKEILTPEEQETAKHLRFKQATLGEVFEVTAQMKGYGNSEDPVGAMIRAESAKPESVVAFVKKRRSEKGPSVYELVNGKKDGEEQWPQHT